MIANFQIGLEDLIAAQRNATVTAQYHKRNKLVMSVVGTILFMIVCVIIVKANFVIIAPFALILFGSIYYFLYEKAVILQTKRLVKNNPSMVPIDCKLTLSEKGVYREFNNSTLNIDWNQIKLANEDTERYFMYTSDIQIIVIKKNPDYLLKEDIQRYNKLIRHSVSQAGLEIKQSTEDASRTKEGGISNNQK